MKRIKHITKQAIAILSMTALTACISEYNGEDHAISGSDRYPITVDADTTSMAVSSMSASEKAMLHAFVAEYKQRGHGPMMIAGPSGRLSRSVESFVKTEGVNHVQRVKGAGSNVTVSFARYTASVSECGRWDDNMATSSRNLSWNNFGCATQNNIAAMLEDPYDLVEPRGMSGLDPDRRSDILEKYRAGEPTATPRDKSEQGTVSEID